VRDCSIRKDVSSAELSFHDKDSREGPTNNVFNSPGTSGTAAEVISPPAARASPILRVMQNNKHRCRYLFIKIAP
jgi:hypothetical protein